MGLRIALAHDLGPILLFTLKIDLLHQQLLDMLTLGSIIAASVLGPLYPGAQNSEEVLYVLVDVLLFFGF